MKLRALLMIGFALLAGCGGGGTLAVAPPRPTPPDYACPLFAINGPKLISPAPGSIGVPESLSTLTFSPISGPITGTATLHGSNGSTLISAALTHSSDGTAILAPITGLQPNTTYTVQVQGTFTDAGCIHAFGADDGSFTTQ